MTLGRRGRRSGTRIALALVAAACALAMMIAAAAAEDATEATTFGADGIAKPSIGTNYEETGFWNLFARADGGLVVQRGEQVESYLADGAPDPAAPPQQVWEHRRVFPLASGKSLVYGEKGLTRVNPDGSVDTSFGDNGRLPSYCGCEAALELPSGKILLASANVGGTKAPIAWVTLQLLNADGSVDRSLGGRSDYSRSIPVSGASVSTIVPAVDGGALVVGGDFLFRLRADGSPDPGFGDQGLVTGLPGLAGARVLPDGSIQAVGAASGVDGSGLDLGVFRYTAAGQPDSSFAPEGIRRFDFGGWEGANVASWGADGSVIVGGRSQAPGPCSPHDDCEETPILAAFDPAGNLDPGFGQGGILRLAALGGLPVGVRGSGVSALARRPDGSIVAAGSAAPNHSVAFLAAVSPQGVLLPGFGEGGIVRVRQPTPATQKTVGFVPLEDGRLLAAATVDLGIEKQPVLIRYAADGSLDTSFGGGAGYVVTGSSIAATGFAVDGTGQALMALFGYPHSSLVRLNAADGSPVQSFGANGAVRLPGRVGVEDLDFARDGDAIVLGGIDISGDALPGVVLRYLPNGKPDPAFGRKGRVRPRLPAGVERLEGKSLALGPGGRILVGGIAGHRFAVTRLLSDGRPDPRFGAGGWSLTSTGDPAKSLTLRRVGSRIYLAGVVGVEGRLRAVLMRFHGDGRPDRGFGRRGRLATPIHKPAQPKAILPTGDGVLVVLSAGPKPLLYFDRKGKVRRDWPGPDPQSIDNVRATVAGGDLVLGWNSLAKDLFGPSTYYLSKRSLDRR